MCKKLGLPHCYVVCTYVGIMTTNWVELFSEVAFFHEPTSKVGAHN